MDNAMNTGAATGAPQVAWIKAEMDRIHDASYTGSDEEGLATVTVDGRGGILSAELAVDVHRRDADAVGRAVKAAFDAAYRNRVDAFTGMAARLAEQRGLAG